ncbi:histidine phosphatase family protein [Bacillus spizizenii]|nr:histidine phosphatase family protein [Bacillus spizizenii]MCY8799946.1 histidine phosphatase family protein [Bacillus spizizenii]MCY8880054.1 histidine phosphatase family protein [Bacillus spizizenii]MCY9232248.1 histidine phosphatase family protein [Bacillus spizizenii]MCY9255004.1 histidine phosphatase family protein [Bacillus spizizenii]
MLHLYIARHGQTQWNVEKRMQGWLDSDLTELGLYNARALGERLKDIELNQVYISPSKRTEETAKTILGPHRPPLVIDHIFREMSLGSWEGKKQEDIERDEPDLFHAYFHYPEAYRQQGCETFFDFENRVRLALQTILDSHSSGNVLLVTHSVFILMLLNIIKGRRVHDIWNSAYIHDTSLSLVEFDENGTAKIVKEGDGKHRKPISAF